MRPFSSHAYSNMLKRGSRIALRAKVNDASISGLTIVDSILPVGRGQRQLILGDRYTGKTSIFPILPLLWSLFRAISLSDTKPIIANPTISQI